MEKRGKAYKLWMGYLKYVSRINRNLYYWRVNDKNTPRGYRNAKNWKELDADSNSKIKLYKKTSKFWRDASRKIESHQKIKITRRESKDLENNALKDNTQ